MARVVPEASQTSAWPWIALFAVAFTPLAHAAAIEKFLSADGALYFQRVLEEGRFTDFAWARNHAVSVVQWPVAVAVRAGVTDWATLETLFAIGLLLPYVLGFVLCVAARRGLSTWPLLFPIASLLVITIPADYLLVGEHHVLVALAWPILFLALRPAALTRWEIGVAGALILVIARAYESAVFVSPVLAAAFLVRGRRGYDRPASIALLAGLCLIGAVIAAFSIAFPRDPGNRSAFLQALVAPARRSQVLLGAAFLIPFALALWRPRDHLRWLAVAVAAVMALCVLGPSGVVPAWTRMWTVAWAGDSFASRTLSMTLLPLLLVVATALVRREGTVTVTQAHVAAFALFAVAVAAVSVQENRQWIEFRSAFKTVLATRTGFVPIESTPLVSHPAGWPWNNAILSYLWSDGAVRAIVLNPADVGWEPFDPRTTAILQRYRQPAFPLDPR